MGSWWGTGDHGRLLVDKGTMELGGVPGDPILLGCNPDVPLPDSSQVCQLHRLQVWHGPLKLSRHEKQEAALGPLQLYS